VLSFLRKALPFLTVAIAIGAAYDAWIFYSRWHDARTTEHQNEHQNQEKKAEDDGRIIGKLGGGQLKILDFYSDPGAIHRGQKANICYGVYGAKSVRMEPPAGDLHPALTYCLQVTPSKSTEYKLVAEDGEGHTATQSFVLRVTP
jgi:hypothetical protein